jgi:hypothetical protein
MREVVHATGIWIALSSIGLNGIGLIDSFSLEIYPVIRTIRQFVVSGLLGDLCCTLTPSLSSPHDVELCCHRCS